MSPVRNQVDAELRWNATLRGTFFACDAYARSRYHDPNLFLVGGVLGQQTRLDDTNMPEAGVLYRLTPSTQLEVEYGLRSNNSNIDRYSYTSHRYLLTFQYHR